MPLNDPFGGWVNWSKLPRVATARVEVVPGGGAQAWGNAALSGAVQVLTWKPVAAVSFSAAYQFSDSRVMHSAVAPALTGKRLAGVPRHSGTFGITWNAPAAVRITSRVRWLGRQFDDDENEIRLGEAVVADVGLSRPLGKNVELFLNIENAGNVRIETARTATGIVSTGTPRFAYGGIRGSW